MNDKTIAELKQLLVDMDCESISYSESANKLSRILSHAVPVKEQGEAGLFHQHNGEIHYKGADGHFVIADVASHFPDDVRKSWGYRIMDALSLASRESYPTVFAYEKVCELYHKAEARIKELESTPAPVVEPLAVLAEQKGCWVSRSRHLKDRWVINLDTLDYNIPDSPPFISDTYAAAESAARAYLEGLPDVKGEGR